MIIDNRKKGCPNELCQLNEKKKLQKAEIDYCPKCGTKLVYVCTKCFSEIEDLGPKHKICSRCDAEAQEKKKAIVDGVKGAGGKAAKAIGGAAAGIAVGVGGKVLKDGKKGAIDAGVKFVEGAAKAMLKK